MTELTGCVMRPLDAEACGRWLERVTATGPVSQEGDDLFWLLAHCDDGVVWGKREGARWRLSSTAFPDVSPPLGGVNVQQVRLFGPLREVLIWRTEEGLRGRELSDTDTVATDDLLRPEDQSYILVGDRLLAARDGFSLVADGRGARHAVPLSSQESSFGPPENRRWPLRLQVRHYFSADPGSGLVRVTVSRLVHLTMS
jgi:CRISPR-associated protein (TIGR03984 family)